MYNEVAKYFDFLTKIIISGRRENERGKEEGSKEDRDVGEERRDELEAQTVSKKRKKDSSHQFRSRTPLLSSKV